MASGSKVLPNYREVFSVLEGLGSIATSPEEVEKLLGSATDFLKEGLDSFKAPSQASKSAVESGTVSGYGDQPLNLNESIRKVTVEASTRLALDEVQTYALLRRCVDEDKSPLPTACDDDLVVRLTRYYFAERLQLMKCIQALLERGTDAEHDDEEELMPALTHSRACLRNLLSGSLEEKLTGALCSHMRGATPARPVEYSKDRRCNAQLAKMWATQALEETQVMLDCAFYMYYSPANKCSATRFAQLAAAFEGGALSRAPASAAELVNNAWVDGERGEEYARETVNSFSDSFRSMCSVILIEAMDLEDVVSSLSAADGGDAHAMLNVDAMMVIATALAKWPSDVTHGPVLLAWATLVSLAPSAASGLTPPPEADPAGTAERAAAGDAGFDSLLSLLRMDYIKGIGHACKSVLKNLFTASLAAFDVLPVQSLKPGELDTLLNILSELVEGQPILCEQFWGGSHGDGQEAPLMNLLLGCRERHPADGVPLLRALSSLSSGPDAAACALAFISKSPTVALPAPGPGADMVGSIVPVGPDGEPTRRWKNAIERWEGEYADYEQRASMGWSNDAPPAPPLPAGPVRANVPLASAYLPGAAIPAGTRGVAIARMGSTQDAADEGEGEEDEDDENAVMATAGPSTSGPGADIVTWDAPADGFAITIARLCVLSTAGAVTDADAGELDAILCFIAKVLASAPSFAAKFAAVDVSEGVPQGTPTTILAALTAVISTAMTPGRAWSTLPCKLGGKNHPGLERTALALSAAAPLAAAVPSSALAQLSATPLLHADTGMARGALASMHAPGPAIGLAMFERSVLPAECTTGEYPVTLALLGLTAKLLWAGAGAAPMMTPILQHVFQEVLVQHGMWRYRRRADRWAMHAALVRVIAAALAPRPGPANGSRRAAVAGFVSSDAAAAAATLAPLTMDADTLRRMHDVHAAEVGAAEDAVAATLGMLPPLMSVFAEVAKEKNSPSPLEPGPLTHALLVEGPGGSSPLAAAVASYAAYPFDATFRPLALPALAALCAAAPVDPPLACALPSLAPASGAHSAFALPYNDTDVGKKGEGDAKLDVRAAIVNALKPHAARGDPDGFRAAAALVTAAAVRQPMLAESMLIPAKLGAEKPDETEASMLDSLYECLGEAKEMRANDPRSLASALKSLFSVWDGDRLLGGAIATLRGESSLVSRLENCLPTADDEAEADDEVEAFRFSVEASAMSILASETASAADGVIPARDTAIAKSVRAWCDASGGESLLLRWLRRWMKIRHNPGTFSRARSHAHAVVLLAAAETERAGAVDLPDASLRDGAADAATALLSHAAAQQILMGGAPRAAVLDVIAAGAAASAAGQERPRSPGDPVGRLLEAARTLRLERAVLAPPTPAPLPGFDPEIGGDFLYNTGWIEAATGYARPVDGVGEGAFGSAEADGPLARAGHAAAEALRLAGRAASRESSQLSALNACLGFLDAAAGTVPAVTMDDEEAIEAPPHDDGMLSSWPAKERRAAVRLALEALESAMVAANEEGADHAKALAVELAEVLAVLVRLWGHAMESPAAVSPTKAVGFGSSLNLPASSADPDDGAINAFTVAADVARVAVEALAKRSDNMDGDTVDITRALLAAVLASVRAWRARAESAPAGTPGRSGSEAGTPGRDGSPLREGNRLGQILWPLVPMLCGAASTPNGGTDSVIALSVLRELADGLLSTPQLAAAMQSRAPLPPLEPPRPPRSPSPLAPIPGGSLGDSVGQTSLVSVPFKYLGDAPTMALRPFLELNAAIDGADGKENLQANIMGAEGSFDAGVFGGVEVPAALRLCLVLGRSAEGAESLHRLGLIGQLTTLCKSLSGSTYHPAPTHQPSPTRGRGRNGHTLDAADEPVDETYVDPAALYCLALRVAATHADAVGSKPEVTDELIALATELADRFAAALAPAELTVAALAEAEATATFLHSLAAASNGPWQLKAPAHQVRMRASAVDFLRWIAAPPPPRRGVSCAPRGSTQAAAAKRPPLVGASTGWFHSCALGSVPPVAATPAAAIAAAVAANDRSSPAGNAHSELIAGRLYATAARCAAFLASFPRANPAAALGTETLDSLSGQAVALSEELAQRRAGSSSFGSALCDALTMTAKSMFKFASALERLEAGEPNLPDPPALRLHSSYSLVSQMSWREATNLDP